MEHAMISMTRSEFDAVSTALIEAFIEGARRKRLKLTGLPTLEAARRTARLVTPSH